MGKIRGKTKTDMRKKSKEEIWKSVKGYEGLYEVSNFGRVRSLPRNTTSGKILKPVKTKEGYLRVDLSKKGRGNLSFVHRLVAETFLDNPDNLPCVNHRDENPLNNRVENLEWCTHLYNMNYGTRNERIGISNKNGKLSKTVYQYTLDGEFVREWESTSEIQRQTGWWNGNISNCCLGRTKTAYGFRWSYKNKILKYIKK